jgi:hypothetical protein
LFSVVERREENFLAMPPRRRDRPMPDLAVEREMHELCDRIDAMETAQRHTINAGDINEAESENEDGNEGEEVAVEDAVDECLFRDVSRIGAREKIDSNSLLTTYRSKGPRQLTGSSLPHGPKNFNILLFPYREICTHRILHMIPSLYLIRNRTSRLRDVKGRELDS